MTETRVEQRPLKILMTDPHLKGGGQVRYVSNLAQELVRLGHDVTIGCKAGSVLIARAGDVGARAHARFAFKGGLRPGAWLHDLGEMRRFIVLERPDLVHVSGSQDHWVAALANRSLGSPVTLVRTRHNTYPVHDGLSNRLLNRDWTDYQIVVCDAVRRTLAAQRAFDAARLCAIHNGVDAEAYRPNPEARRRLRAEFGYAEEHLVVGIAARLVPAKGHAYLFRAAARIREAHPALRVLVLGQGELEGELTALARDMGIAPIVHFAGFRDDVQDCVQAFDMGVQPSIDCDTSSFSLKEQMAAEKPVVASDYGGLTEIVTDGEEGLIVAAGAHEPLAQALAALLADPERRAAMGKAGRARVLREFSIEIFARRTLDAYGRAIEVHRERTAH